jgi:23S rRNA pseudouridine1911/1915/1917 synthase
MRIHPDSLFFMYLADVMSQPETITYTASDADGGTRIDRVLANRFPDYSRSQIQRAIETGALSVNGTPAKANYRAAAGDVMTLSLVRPEPDGQPPTGEDIALDVVYEDEQLLVINKPAGMVVHPAAGHRTGTLVNALLGRGTFQDDESESSSDRPGIVHRLDKGTSGLMVVARTETAHRHLARQLRDRTLSRIYWAIVWGHLKKSPVVIDAPIGRSLRDRKRMAVNDSGREAKTTFRSLERYTLADWVEAALGTGRTHQIRVHLSHAGHSVVGDEEYGGGEQRIAGIDPRRRALGRRMLSLVDHPALHAQNIAFAHPETDAPMRFSAPPPADFQQLLDLCRTES